MALLAGGMITAPLLSVFVIPAVYRILRRRALRLAPSKLSLSSASLLAIDGKRSIPHPDPLTGYSGLRQRIPKAEGED